MSLLGRSVPRREGIEKLTGRAVYVDDRPAAGVWFGGTIRSTEPRARLRRLVQDPRFPWSRVVLVLPDDIPGENVVPLLRDDQPVLATREIRHPEEPLALVAAPDKELLARALAAIRVETEALPPLLDLEEAAARANGAGGLFKRIEILKGDPDAAFPGADLVVEAEYAVGSQEHVYIEPQGMEARWDGDAVTVYGSLQCPYYVVHGLARILGLPEDRVRVVQQATGGGFGGKEANAGE